MFDRRFCVLTTVLKCFVNRDVRQTMMRGSQRTTWHACDRTCSSRCPTHPLTRRSRVLPSLGGLVAYDSRRYQGMTPRRQRSRHPRASSPLDRQRRRMLTSTTPREDLVLPRHITPRARARVDLSTLFCYYELS